MSEWQPISTAPKDGTLIEVKARAVVAAWERLGSCFDEMGPDYCGEYQDALDDAIVALRAHLTAPEEKERT